MSNVVRFPKDNGLAAADTRPGEVDILALSQPLAQLRMNVRREVRSAILLLDCAVFRLRQVTEVSGAVIPREVLNQYLLQLDELLDAARESARKL